MTKYFFGLNLSDLLLPIKSGAVFLNSRKAVRIYPSAILQEELPHAFHRVVQADSSRYFEVFKFSTNSHTVAEYVQMSNIDLDGLILYSEVNL